MWGPPRVAGALHVRFDHAWPRALPHPRVQELRLALRTTGRHAFRAEASEAGAGAAVGDRARAKVDPGRQPSVNAMLTAAFKALTWERVRRPALSTLTLTSASAALTRSAPRGIK